LYTKQYRLAGTEAGSCE